MNKVFYFFFSCCVQHQVIFDGDITRCLWWYYCPQITGTTLQCEIWWVQGNYSLCPGEGVLPRGLVGSRSREIGCYADRIALKFDRHSGSTSEVPVKIQSDWRNLNLSLAASRPRGVLGWGVGRPLLVRIQGRILVTCCAEHNVVSIDR